MAPSNLIQALFLTFSFALTLSFAPQDVSQYCIDNALVPDYPQTVKPLMDSWSYQYLLEENGVWQSINLDQYPESVVSIKCAKLFGLVNEIFTDMGQWVSSEDGESCSNSVFVREPSNLPQDNWLITQHITKSITQQSILYPSLIYVNLTYKIESGCAICHNTFQLLSYNTNTTVSDISNRTSDFTLLANLTDSGGVLSTMFTETFVIEPELEGFYLALRDYGTNVTVSRFLVYRLIGPAKQVGLTLYPETPAPSVSGISVSGVCVANANTTDGSLPILNLDPNGSWINTVTDQCYCIEGHQLIMLEGFHQCQACPPGTYKSLKNNSQCLSCPMNSASTVHGASICPCNGQYYRAPFETAVDVCTVPPGPPTNLLTSELTNTSVVLEWTAPSFLGGRTDTYYDIYSSNNAKTVLRNTAPVMTTNYQVTGLLPNSFFQITVTAENGVSSLAGNAYLRSAITFLTTSDGVPPQVTGLYVRMFDSIVEWLHTSSIYGTILSYEVQLFSSEADGEVNSVDGTDVLYEVNVTMDFPISGQPVNVRVRAFTDAGPGEWSEPELFAQINPLAPTTSLYSSTASSTVMASLATGTSSSPFSSVLSTSSITKPTSTTSNTHMTTSSSNSATPTQSPEGSNPIIAIVAVVVGAIVILVIVAIGAVLYFIFRMIRLKHEKKKEDIDYAPLVHYSAATADSEDEIKVELKQ